MLTFDSTSHVYRWNSRRIPSVTQCLEPLFDWTSIPRDVLEHKRQVGIAVHHAIHLELSGGGLDFDTIHPDCRGYFETWQNFRKECRFDPWLIEYQVTSDELGEYYRYAGTLDEYGLLQGQPALIDWKTSMVLNEEAVGAQTAAYLKALHRNGIAKLSDRRYALKLSKAGLYRLEPYRRLDDDWRRFVDQRKRWQPERLNA